jgi:hypothetical protein
MSGTSEMLIHDAEKALNILIQQSEVDPNRISIIGHSEGTVSDPTRLLFFIKNEYYKISNATTMTQRRQWCDAFRPHAFKKKSIKKMHAWG